VEVSAGASVLDDGLHVDWYGDEGGEQLLENDARGWLESRQGPVSIEVLPSESAPLSVLEI